MKIFIMENYVEIKHIRVCLLTEIPAPTTTTTAAFVIVTLPTTNRKKGK
jgi:hypothetical protein